MSSQDSTARADSLAASNCSAAVALSGVGNQAKPVSRVIGARSDAITGPSGISGDSPNRSPSWER